MTIKDIGPAIFRLLSTDVGVAAVVGARIFPFTLPQGVTQPSISYAVRTETRDYHMNGPSGLAQDRIQIDCWGLTRDAASSLANLVEDELSGFRGTVSFGSSSPQESVTIQAVFHDIGNDIYDPTAKLYSKQRDYFFWYYNR